MFDNIPYYYTNLNDRVKCFIQLLDRLDYIKESSVYRYACCNRIIEKEGKSVYIEENCPHCLDHYDSISYKDSNGWQRTLEFTPKINHYAGNVNIPELDGNGNQILTLSRNGVRHSTLSGFESEFGKLKFIGKRKRVIFENQEKYNIITNIIKVVELPQSAEYLQYNEFYTESYFGELEFKYLESNGWLKEFNSILIEKQSYITNYFLQNIEALYQRTDLIFQKMNAAGMSLSQ